MKTEDADFRVADLGMLTKLLHRARLSEFEREAFAEMMADLQRRTPQLSEKQRAWVRRRFEACRFAARDIAPPVPEVLRNLPKRPPGMSVT